jgi:hypothetical protein
MHVTDSASAKLDEIPSFRSTLVQRINARRNEACVSFILDVISSNKRICDTFCFRAEAQGVHVSDSVVARMSLKMAKGVVRVLHRA